jgi:hypothetical protein
MVAPVAILWTDADSQWEPLVSQLGPLMPELFTLGEYNPDEKTGPAIWLRCVIERALPDVELPEDAIPIIYMPNVSRQTLRAVEECPDSLKPLVELQYRGAVWTQRNGRDWTVEAFLVSEDGGLGLDVARDRHTRRSMIGALGQLAVTPISRLIGKKLEAEDFDKLMIEDTPRDLLVWMNSPAETQEKWDGNKWMKSGKISGGALKNHHHCILAYRKYSGDQNLPASLFSTKSPGLMRTTARKNRCVKTF